MLVYRFEDEYGLGPFGAGVASYAADAAFEAGEIAEPWYHNSLPSPFEENLPVRDDLFCAAISVELALIWFTPAMCGALGGFGWLLSVYEAEEVYVGAYQVMFNRGTARLVNQINAADAPTLLNPLPIAA